MGWLKCNPDEIYVPAKFVLYDLPEYLPGPMADFTRALSRYVPSAIATSLGSLSITARPMQVTMHAQGLPVSWFSASSFDMIQRNSLLQRKQLMLGLLLPATSSSKPPV